MSTNPENVRPIRPRNADLDRLGALHEEIGEQRAMLRLRELGEIFCVAPDVSLGDLGDALRSRGLTFSSVAGVQLIHRVPLSAA